MQGLLRFLVLFGCGWGGESEAWVKHGQILITLQAHLKLAS